MQAKDDYLRECLSDIGNMPLDQFNQVWCRLCGNRGCSRSALNNSLFDERSRDWKKMFFENPPTANLDDPTYSNIRGKSFTPGHLPVISSGGPAVIDRAAMTPNQGFAPSAFTPRPGPEAPMAAPIPDMRGDPESPAEIPDLETQAPAGGKPEAPPILAPPSSPPQPPREAQFEQGMMIGSRAGTELGPGQTYVLEDD